MKLQFYKYHGTGNDFIILDNRSNTISLTIKQIRKVCHRRFGIGADGFMLLNNKEDYDFEMKYYNSDGHEGSMCGNGGRCMVQFACDIGVQKTQYQFWAIDGAHEATISDSGWIYLKMNDVNGIETGVFGDVIVNTGSPHYVKAVSDLWNYDVVKQGKEIRYSDEFKAEGINVNFVQESGEEELFVRTYERGVEDETLSCGTGAAAAALVFAHNSNGFNRVEIKTPGGRLAVEFNKVGDNKFENIWLCGPARFVFNGEMELEDDE